MDQPQSGRPANASRPARRSLVEFALPASGGRATVQPAPATERDKQPFETPNKGRKKIMHEPLNEDQKAAAGSLRPVNNPDGLASVNARTASLVSSDMPEQVKNIQSQSADKTIPIVARAADEYRAKAFELMTANINTTFEYAQRLVNVNTPTKFVELSASHARKQFELIMKQAAEFGLIAQRLARYPGSSE
jgi:hypothetical protein